VSAWTTPSQLTAAKDHCCDWCGERIDAGTRYWRWRWFSHGDAATCKAHPECYAAMQDAAQDNGGDIEFTPGDHSRGSIGETA
jgi:hypothetical protein